MSSLTYLRHLICERLTAAAEEIFTHVERIVVEYEDEVDRQRRLLEVVCKPHDRSQRSELPQQNVWNEEEVLSDQQLWNCKERNSSLDQEEPLSLQIKEEDEEICTSQEQFELKQEADTFMLTPDDEESDHMEPDSDHQFLSHSPPIFESQDQTGSKKAEITINKSEEEVDHQRVLLKIVWEHVMSQQIELPQQNVYNDEEVLIDQERNSSLDQKEPESLQIKEEEEEIYTSRKQEQLELKQEADTFMLTPDNVESDHMEPEPGTDHQLSHSPPIVKSQDKTVHIREIRSKKSHMCNICEKSFVSKGHLIIHERTHTGEKPYICNICMKSFAEKGNLVNHMRTHTSERPYSCETCGKCFRQIAPLIQHRKTHTGEKPYVCSVCNACFGLKSTLIKHTRTHTGEKPFNCHICKTYFGHKSSLIKHMRTHTGEKPYSCELCGKCFRQSSHLILHKRTHTGERPYACSICEKCFVQKNTLKKHMRTHR
ncbi:zinc finger protein 771-like [Solea solea]|uniref:zinc finger protein 771-like n=1 Tax=Solea solea TaxID=90069 RepID=UPI002729AED1|nr:zinc finger protein 771-like [Solea solea]